MGFTAAKDFPTAYYLVRGRIRPERHHPITRLTIALYRPILRGVLRVPGLTLLAALLLTLVTIWPATRLGTEFMPPLNEGDLLYMPTTSRRRRIFLPPYRLPPLPPYRLPPTAPPRPPPLPPWRLFPPKGGTRSRKVGKKSGTIEWCRT